MKVLILSFKAGEGHNSASAAIRERIEAEGGEAIVTDFMSLYSGKISDMINKTYVSTVQHVPFIFGFFYKIGDLISRLFGKSKLRSGLYLSSSIVSKKLKEYMEENGPYDAVIATHLMPAQALAHMKREGYSLPLTVAVATDYSCYPFWEEANAVDYYIIPSETMKENYEKRGIPSEKCLVYGIPTSMRFQNLPTREEAREKLGLEKDALYYLIMGGSMGAGNMKKLAEGLRKNLNGKHMIVVCGRNEQLKNQMDLVAMKDPEHIHILGFTKEIPAYMAACDVLFTKPGGLTSSEALVCNIPMVHTAPIPGCESDNFEYFGKHHCSMPAKTIRKQISAGVKLMNSEELRTQLREGQKKHAKPNSSKDIYNLIQKYIDEQNYIV